MFSSDEVKINYIIGLLRGRALVWAQVSSMSTHLNTLTFDDFVRRFEWIFNRLNHEGCAADCLFSLHQGLHWVAEYAVEFGTLAVESGWNEAMLQGAFRQGLSGQVRDALVCWCVA